MLVIKECPPWNKEVVCSGMDFGGGGCGSTLCIDKFDLYYSTDAENTNTMFVTFRCCLCGTETSIPLEEVPPAIKAIMPDKKRWTVRFAEERRQCANMAKTMCASYSKDKEDSVASRLLDN